jgi:hypothetical protein
MADFSPVPLGAERNSVAETPSRNSRSFWRETPKLIIAITTVFAPVNVASPFILLQKSLGQEFPPE